MSVLHDVGEGHLWVLGVQVFDLRQPLDPDLISIADLGPVDGEAEGVLVLLVERGVVLHLLSGALFVLEHAGPLSFGVEHLPAFISIVVLVVADMCCLDHGGAMKRHLIFHTYQPARLVVGEEVGVEA